MGDTANADGAASRTMGTGHHFEQGRLAGSVVPDEGDDLARVDVDVDVVERPDVAVVLLDAAQLQRGDRGSGPRSRLPPAAGRVDGSIRRCRQP